MSCSGCACVGAIGRTNTSVTQGSGERPKDVQRRLAEGERFAATRYDDRTSVDLAVGAGSPEIVQTLLAAGEEPNPSRRRGIRALHLAALALAHVSPVEQALHRAACLHIARMLLEAGADPNAPDRDGNPALHYARDFPEMFRLLLEFGADPEQRNNFGNISREK